MPDTADVGTNCSEPFQHARLVAAFYSGPARRQHDERIWAAGNWQRMPASYHEGCVVWRREKLAPHCEAMVQSTLEQCTSLLSSLTSYTVEVDSSCYRIRMPESPLRAAASATCLYTRLGANIPRLFQDIPCLSINYPLFACHKPTRDISFRRAAD